MRADAQALVERINAATALLRRFLDWDRALVRLDELNARVEDPTLWNDQKAAQEVMRERRRLDEAISATRAIEEEMAPRLAAFSDKITQNAALFARIEAVYNSPDKAKLTAEQQAWWERHRPRHSRHHSSQGGLEL